MAIVKRYGLIGYPLGHSFSKQYFSEKFQREEIEAAVFDNYPISDINQLPEILQTVENLLGLSVTIPYKEQVLQYVTEQSEEVQATGATNSLHIRNGHIKAFNTDIIGFEQSFAPMLRPGNEKALVLGTGGAAKAVHFVLKKMNIPFLSVSRQAKEGCIPYAAIDTEMMKAYSIIINCTPAGMEPHINTCPPLPYHLITPAHCLFDLVYKPSTTVFMQHGQKAGAVVKNGFDMLLLQAEASWKIWNEVY
jgi:shikimate dehydrogenase